MAQPCNQSNAWRVVAASFCGTSHKRTGKPCQDAHCWKVLPQSVLVASVADGAGSAPLAEVGASIASLTAVETARSELDDLPLPKDDEAYKSLLINSIRAARGALDTEARVRSVEARDLATTLILLLATPNVIAAVHVGDGAVIAGDQDNNIISITRPQFGEYINEAIFITSSSAIERAQVNIWRGPVAYIALLSDGLQMLALQMPEGTPHTPFFSSIFQFLRDVPDTMEAQAELETFLSSPRVTERTDDDLTLLLATLVV